MATVTDEYQVSPHLPTVLGSQEAYDLLSIDLLPTFVPSLAWILPGPLDLPRFNNALASALSVYPLFCGRVRPASEKGGLWKIALLNRPISVTLVSNPVDAGTIPSCVIPSSRPLSRNLVEEGRITGPAFLDPENDEPLLRLTVTSFTSSGYTGIGLIHSHIVADASCISRFVRLISTTYQGLPSADPEPTYDRAAIPPLPNDEKVIKEFHERMPFLFQTYPIGGPYPAALTTLPPIKRIVLRFTPAQLDSLKKAVDPSGEMKRLSRNDVICAFIAVVFSTAYNTPIDQITNILNFRGVSNSLAKPHAVGNAVIWSITPPLSPSSLNLTGYAAAIRASVSDSRDPEYLKTYLAVSGKLWQDAAESGRGQYLTHTAKQLTINSSYKMDWTSINFGYVNAKFHHHDPGPFERYVQVLPRNPDPQTGERWEGWAEVTCNVGVEKVEEFGKAVSDAWSTCVGQGEDPEFEVC